ncbi:MAG: diamine N-acetyltransferase [Clostridiales bacterium]|nr:diamine N-acetyltransferase [Clostridiales bacterium]
MNLVFRKLKRKDVYQFSKWGKHEDPRFFQYNFPYEDAPEFDAWYFSKQHLLFKKVYGLFLDDYPLGFITLKQIRWLKRTAELGIAIDPNHLSEGFGAELLTQFLTYVFSRYPITKMTLRVAHFNVRAQKSYSKVGFHVVEDLLEPFEEQGFKDEIMARYPSQFQVVEGILYTLFFRMEIRKEDFFGTR